jgi:hypothetical protein
VAATDVRVLPEVIDFTLITNAAGFGALATTMVGAALRFDRDRLARFTLLGTVVGGGAGAALFLILLVVDVL